MPLLAEGVSKKAWRRLVAEALVSRAEERGSARFFAESGHGRREMLKVVELLPRDLVTELYEDERYPGVTFLEVSMPQAPPRADLGFRIIPANEAVG